MVINCGRCLAIVTVILLLSGCVSNIAENRSETPQIPGSAITTELPGIPTQNTADEKTQNQDAENEEFVANIVSRDELWGPIEEIILDISELFPIAIADSGDMLCTVWESETNDMYAEPVGTLMVYNIYSESTMEICKLDRGFQVTWGAINENWIMYLPSSMYGYSAGEVYIYNRKSGETALLYSMLKDENGQLIGHIVQPELKDDEVLLDTVSEMSDVETIITSYKYDLNNGTKQVVAEQFALPQFGEDCVFGLCEYEGPNNNNALGYSVICKFEDGQLIPLMKEGTFVYEYDADGYNSVMYTGQSFENADIEFLLQSPSVYLIEDGKTIMLKKATYGGMDGCDWPSLNRRVAMWRSEQGAYAYDRKLQKTVKLTEEGNFTAVILVTDKYMMWSCVSKKNLNAGVQLADELHIIETDSLP